MAIIAFIIALLLELCLHSFQIMPPVLAVQAELNSVHDQGRLAEDPLLSMHGHFAPLAAGRPACRTNILVGCMFIVGMLLITSGVKADDIPEP